MIYRYQFMNTRYFLFFGALLCMVSAIHRNQMGTPGYFTSPLITAEMILMIMVTLLILSQIVTAIYFLIFKRWNKLSISGLNFAIGSVALTAAMLIDSPTLMFVS